MGITDCFCANDDKNVGGKGPNMRSDAGGGNPTSKRANQSSLWSLLNGGGQKMGGEPDTGEPDTGVTFKTMRFFFPKLFGGINATKTR